MFDEMSIRKNLHFDQKYGYFGGYEDLGSQGKTINIGNHAPFFMLRGLRKRWKQPVAYYLVHGSTKCEMFVNFLKEALDAWHDTEMEVVATVYDMGAKNINALKLLVVSEETNFSSFMIKNCSYISSSTSP